MNDDLRASENTEVQEPPLALENLSRDELWSLWRSVRDRMPDHLNELSMRTVWIKLNDALGL